MPTADVLVVGGGVCGCAVAWSLAREGVSVALLERDDLASQASGAAAGMLLPVGEARARGPLWIWGRRSLARFPSLAAELRERSGIDPEYEASGALHVPSDERDARALRERAQALGEPDLEWLDARAARDVEPQLSAELPGALWSPSEAHVRSPLLTRAFAAAAAQLGARIERGVAVLGLRREGDRACGVETDAGAWSAGCTVLCTGAWAPAAAAWLGGGPPLPIEPVRGQILSLDAPQPPPRAIVSGGAVYLVPKRDGSVVVGATEERVGFDCRVTAEGMARLLAAAPRLVPALAQATFRSAWAGLRPATPDGLPLLGPLPGVERLVLAAGHARNGVLLAPVTAQLVTDCVLGKALPPDAAAFSPDRFV